MSMGYFSCPTCEKVVPWSAANANGTGSFCSDVCATADQKAHLLPEGSQMQMSPEDWNERYWRFRSQVGEHDLPDDHGQIEA